MITDVGFIVTSLIGSDNFPLGREIVLLIHENTGFLDSDAQRCTFVCRYSEINQKIRRGRSLVQQPDQKAIDSARVDRIIHAITPHCGINAPLAQLDRATTF